MHTPTKWAQTNQYGVAKACQVIAITCVSDRFGSDVLMDRIAGINKLAKKAVG